MSLFPTGAICGSATLAGWAESIDPPEGALGHDAASITLGQLTRALAGSRAPLKARLMDQARVAGVGDLIADEVLWRASLSLNGHRDRLHRPRSGVSIATCGPLSSDDGSGRCLTGGLMEQRRAAEFAPATANRSSGTLSADARRGGARGISASPANPLRQLDQRWRPVLPVTLREAASSCISETFLHPESRTPRYGGRSKNRSLITQPSTSQDLDPVYPSPLVRILIRPMTKVLNPLMGKFEADAISQWRPRCTTLDVGRVAST